MPYSAKPGRRQPCAGGNALQPGRFLMCCGGLAALLLVAGTAQAAAGRPPAVNVQLCENGERVVLRYTLGGFEVHPVHIHGQEFARVRLPGEPLSLEAGAPELPRVCRSIVIPDQTEVAVRVLTADYHDVPLRVAPSRGPLARHVRPSDVPYSFGSVYGVNAFYPNEIVRLGRPYVLRECCGTVVELWPFQYNPVAEVLRVYTDVTVEVLPTPPDDRQPLRPERRWQRPSRAFRQLCEHHFINYLPTARYTAPGEEGELLIIVHDPWIPNVEPLALHKNSIGIPTTAVGVATIGNDAAAIKAYIQNVYDTGNLAFVLLVGDAEQVATPYVAGGPSDPSYAKLAGGDAYPDIMVGRFSAQIAAEVDTQVQRTIEYESQAAPLQDWFWRGAGIGADAGHLDGLRDELLAYGYAEVDQLYDPGVTPEAISAALNAGRGIVNYAGQGSTTFWGSGNFSVADVHALVNDNVLPFIVSVASLNGDFTVYECFAESWLRARHGSAPTGAIAAYMSAGHQYWDGPLVAQEEFVHLYVSETHVRFGTLCFAGACRMMDEYGATGAEMFDTWTVFGDPSLRVVGSVRRPGDMNCDGEVNSFDIDPFVLALTDPAAYAAAHPRCDIDNADCNGDGSVNTLDIDPFVALLVGVAP